MWVSRKTNDFRQILNLTYLIGGRRGWYKSQDGGRVEPKSGLKPHVIWDRFLTSSFEVFNKDVFHLIWFPKNMIILVPMYLNWQKGIVIIIRRQEIFKKYILAILLDWKLSIEQK